ncbi:hypothetical protein [uncultured Acinetobacter sp.]|uniref:energy transducer TonB n=1 Tax=uncultured Acinetobacter sp. TaxID=165433 RepID=UPI0026136C0E|nr:hypothetical protein [uncultured Acinetobacter sp.]
MIHKLICFGLLLGLNQNICADTATIDQAKPQFKLMHDYPQLEWLRAPKVRLKDGDLEGQPRKISVKIEADSSGAIKTVNIDQSSGLQALDAMIIEATQHARFKPYSQPIYVIQKFEMMANDYQSTTKSKPTAPKIVSTCQFEVVGFTKQQQGQDLGFKYLSQPPKLEAQLYNVGSEDRSIEFDFSLNRHNKITSTRITKGSGYFNLDHRLVTQFAQVQLSAPRNFYQLQSFKFSEKLKLNVDQCN